MLNWSLLCELPYSSVTIPWQEGKMEEPRSLFLPLSDRAVVCPNSKIWSFYFPCVLKENNLLAMEVTSTLILIYIIFWYLCLKTNFLLTSFRQHDVMALSTVREDRLKITDLLDGVLYILTLSFENTRPYCYNFGFGIKFSNKF